MSPARRASVALALAAAAALAARPADATNGAIPITGSARAQGRGGTDTAVADDASAGHTNPAGLAFIYGSRFDGSAGLLFPDISFKNQFGNERSVAAPRFYGAMALCIDPGSPSTLGDAFDIGSFFSHEYGDSYLGPHEGASAADDGRRAQGGSRPRDRAFPGAGGGEEEPRRARPGGRELQGPGERDERARAYAPAPREEPADESAWRIAFGFSPVAGDLVDMTVLTPFYDEDPAATPPQPRAPQDYQANIQVVSADFSFAFRITDELAIGITASAIAGSFEIDGPIEQSKSILQGDSAVPGVTVGELADVFQPGTINGYSDIDDAVSYGFGGRIGLLFRPIEEVSIGAWYAPQTFVQDYLGRAHVDFNRAVAKDGGFQVLNLAIGGGLDPSRDFSGEYDVRIKDFNLPQMASVGLALRPHPDLLIAIDGTWIPWSQKFKKFRVRLTNGDNPNLNRLNGPGAIHVELPLDWEDRFVIAAGVSWRCLHHLTLRAGWNYMRNPIPDETLLFSNPAILEHHFTGGASFLWGPWEFTGSFEYDPVVQAGGGRNIANSDFTNGKSSAGIFSFLIGAGLNF